ncbi:neuropeptide FF receptor 1, partial [Aplysia californica]|uniref:Neuropeptide FF receptor 1 n=1 Tax=Aplysia californica TaxID=6500 RepID=A0ABM0K717_APLCA
MATTRVPPTMSDCPLGSCLSDLPTRPLNLSGGSVTSSTMLQDLFNTTLQPPTDNVTLGNETSQTSNLLSEEAQASLIVLYSLTIIFSVVGNILVVIVFVKGRRSRTDIRPFLINLAIADLIMALFCMPFTFTNVMIRTWVFSKPMCPIVLFMQHLSVSASVFTNMAIGIDRFLVVTFPLRARMTTQRAKYTICVIWLCSVGLSSVQLVVGRATDHGDVIDCNEVWGSPDARRTFTMFVLFITYIIPLVILAVTYSIVSILLWKRTAPGNAHEGRDMHQLRAKRKVIKMLVLVVIMFGVCWLPLHTFFLVIDFNPELMMNQSESQQRISTVLFYSAFWLAMSNSCANPVIYGFTNDSFRADLAALCYRWFPFCLCLKKLATRQFSMSTCDSAYNRRFSTLRKPPATSMYKQTAYRNGSKVYIELHRDMSRERSLASINDFYRDGVPDPEQGPLSSRLRNHHTPTNNHRHSSRHQQQQQQQNHHQRRRRHHHLFRKDSGESTKPLTSQNNNDVMRGKSSSSPSLHSAPVSPDTPTSRTEEFSYPLADSYIRQTQIPEVNTALLRTPTQSDSNVCNSRELHTAVLRTPTQVDSNIPDSNDSEVHTPTQSDSAVLHTPTQVNSSV